MTTPSTYIRFQWQIELLFLLSFSMVLQWPFLNLDLWNDELYTLERFVFTSIANIATDYHVPNNHIFSSLFFHFWSKYVGSDGIDSVIETPWLLRLPMLLLSFATVSCIYFAGEKTQRFVGLFGSMFLICSVPFLNFSLQIRGYGFSLFFVALAFYLISLPSAKFRLIAIAIATTLLAYTIPSNYYLEVGIVVATSLNFLITRESSWRNATLALLVGIAVSIILYIPVFSDVFQNEYVEASTPFNIHRLTDFAPRIIADSLNLRILTVLALIIGIPMGFTNRKLLPIQILVLCAIIVPFLISFVRGDQAPMRSFVTILIPLALLFGLGVSSILSKFRKSNLLILSVIVLIATEGLASIFFTNDFSDAECYYNITHEYRSQNLVTNYYQHRYQPTKDVSNFMGKVKTETVIVHNCEAHGIRHFLNHFGIHERGLSALDSLKILGNPIFVVSSNPDALIDELQSKWGNARVTYFTKNLTYHNFLEVSFDSVELSQIRRIIQKSPGADILFFCPSFAGLDVSSDSNRIVIIEEKIEALDTLNKAINSCLSSEVLIVEYPVKTESTSHLFRAIGSGQITGIDSIGDSRVYHFQCAENTNDYTVDPITLSKESPYSSPYMVKLSADDLNSGFRVMAYFDAQTLKDLSIVLSIDRNNNSIFWDEYQVEWCENSGWSQMIIPTPTIATEGDVISIYFWNKSSNSLTLKSVDISNSGLIKEL